MENHNGLHLILKVRSICRRAAAEGKTTVSKSTLRQIDRQIRQMGGSVRGQAELFAGRSL